MMRAIGSSLAVAVIFAAVSGSALASDADFKLVNRTGYQIDSVFVSPHASKSWGKDIIGSDVLAAGNSVEISFPHGGSACNFDIKVAYKDGDTAEWGNVDLCQYETISLYWDGQVTRAVGE